MTMAVGGNSTTETKMPVLRSGADLEVTAVSNTGDMTISMTFTDGKWIATPSSDPSMMTALNGAILALKGLSGTMVMSNRAFTRDATFDTSKVSNPQLSQAMAPIKQMLQNLSLPLPEEPVGVGATWEVRLGLNANGIQTFSRHSVEVTAMDDKSCTLKMAVEETAPPQSFSNPTIGGATMSVDAFNSTGSGTTKIQFDTLSPTSELNVNTKMTMSIDMGGNAQQMNMAMSMKSTITPGVK
jgi:hypothetical protein